MAAALGVLLIISPVVTATGQNLTADALQPLVWTGLYWVILFAYFLAGLLITVGIGRNRLDVEAAGCALAASGLIIRLIALLATIGLTIPVVATGVFYVVFAGACIERVIQCLRGEHIVRVTTVVKIDGIE